MLGKSWIKSCVNLENIVYHCFRQLWLVLGVKLMEINSNLFSRKEFWKVWGEIVPEGQHVTLIFRGEEASG